MRSLTGKDILPADMDRIKMRRNIFFILIASLGLIFSGQQIQEESIVINVEVPTRIFDGTVFVDNLTIDDFEIYQDGELQKIEAVYMIKKKSIERREEKTRFNPQTSRQFYLWFQMSEYMPQIREAIEYFFNNVIFPGDKLVVITSLKAYDLNDQALENISKAEIADKLNNLIRKDTTSGNLEYRASLRDLQEIVTVIEAKAEEEDGTSFVEDSISPDASVFNIGSIEEVVQMYSTILDKLEKLRFIDQQKLLGFAQYLKNREGQKHIFLFYQRELLPQIDPNILNNFLSQEQSNPSLQLTLASLLTTNNRDISIDVEKVKQGFADSSLSIHFLYLKKMTEHYRGIQMQEKSEDIYGAFSEMAKATGGITESSANPAWAFQRAVDALENYYLLYYSPKNYRRDGKFKKIEVRVKNKKYKITHRAGYYAN